MYPDPVSAPCLPFSTQATTVGYSHSGDSTRGNKYGHSGIKGHQGWGSRSGTEKGGMLLRALTLDSLTMP